MTTSSLAADLELIWWSKDAPFAGVAFCHSVQTMANNLSRPTSELPISFDNPPTEITRQQAAENQLNRAIWLWFGDNASDWPSIHTLTVAAQGVLAAACRGANIPQSKLVTSLKSKPRGFQDAMLSPQNFFKHGYHKQKKRKPDLLGYAPEVIEVYVMDNIETYHRLFGRVTRAMACFTLRFWFDHPLTDSAKQTKAILVKSLGVVDCGKAEFFRKIMSIVGQFEIRFPHIRIIARPRLETSVALRKR